MNRIVETVKTVLLAPFFIAIGILVFGTLGIIAIPFSIRGGFQHRQWLRKMHATGRTLTPTEIAERGGTGTLIVDQPGWGGRAKYCWWTPDDVASRSPLPLSPLSVRIEEMKTEVSSDALPFDRWVYHEYLATDSGTAFLVTAKHGDRKASMMQTDMINLQLIETWSAPISKFAAAENEK